MWAKNAKHVLAKLAGKLRNCEYIYKFYIFIKYCSNPLRSSFSVFLINPKKENNLRVHAFTTMHGKAMPLKYQYFLLIWSGILGSDHMIVLCVMKVTVSDLAIQVEHIFSWETGKATKKVRPLANHCLHPYVSSWRQEECHRKKNLTCLTFRSLITSHHKNIRHSWRFRIVLDLCSQISHITTFQKPWKSSRLLYWH